jgi:predicted HTH domain antitoxin
MAATKTSRNDTPNTPDVDESKIARMKVDDLRRRLKNRGVKGTADLKKPELVKKMIKLETSGSAKSRSGSAKKSVSASSSSSSSSKKKSTSKNDTPNTPDVDESKIARMKVDDLRRELKSRGVKGTADLKKPELVKKMIKASTSAPAKSTGRTSATKAASSATKSPAAKSSTSKSSTAKASTGKSSTAKASTGKSSGTKGSGGKRTGKNTSDSLKYAQEIRSVDDRPEREGRSLVTTDHEVIRQWAKARKAVPATVEGTEHDGHLGVLRLNFPGYSGDRLTEVSWNDWFDAFDKRRLNFIYQQKQTSGKRSNFFQLENPDQ